MKITFSRKIFPGIASALQQHFPDSVASTSEPSSDAVSADVTPLSDLDKSISDALSGKGAVAVQN